MKNNVHKIRIAYVVTFAKNVGVYNVVSNLACNLDKSKFDVTVIACLNDNDEREIKKLNDNNVKFLCLNFSKKVNALLFGIFRLKKILNKINADIVHSHAIIADYIVTKLSKKYKKITTVHCNLEEDYLYHYGYNKYKYVLKKHISILKKFDEVVGCSSSVKKSLDAYIDNSKYVINCLDTLHLKYNSNTNSIRGELGISDDDIVYLYIGSLSNRKNVITLIDNFEKYSNCNEHLLLIGSGELFDCCTQICKDINNIHILGQINEPAVYLNASDIFISFSKSEGMPLSVIESLSCGLYLLLSNIESHKEVFDICNDNVDYYIGELFDVDNFIYSLKKIRKKYNMFNKQEIISIKEKYFSVSNMIKGYSDIYEKCIFK